MTIYHKKKKKKKKLNFFKENIYKKQPTSLTVSLI